ncbi:EPIDERMAL PATTERNING FACTOR-like protein 6 [Senna tora]|uniref:Epidermal patterning factor-like protein n=1 Tax=Senna tora TaxID=362788 RepID=A0A834T529_9FABA|nr:EPIDERMAL PATTERNING FACTOR-like protein 6 [Senna tora]
MEKKNRKINNGVIILLINKLSFTLCFIFIFCNLLISTTSLDTRRPSSPMFAKADRDFQKSEEGVDGQGIMHGGTREVSWIWPRRNLGGPGSSPPRCKSKCGTCTPCRPVHVAVPPGTPVTAEYYPEAWRCKCGNRLYMP